MKNLTFPLCFFVVCILTLTSCSTDSVDETTSANLTANVAPVSYTSMELEILDQVNAYRSQNGLNELEDLDEGSRQAATHNAHMIKNNEVCHDFFAERYTALVKNVQAKAVSENVGFGFNSASAVVAAWIKSEDHRKNMLGNHTHFGISVEKATDGKYYFTNIFIRK